MELLLIVSCFAVSILALSDPTITPFPELHQRAGTTFIGYYSSGSSYQRVGCRDGSVWTTSSTFGICCPATTVCAGGDYITRCSSNYAVFGDGISVSCMNGSPSVSYRGCNTDQILESFNDAVPTLYIGCDVDGYQTNFYRTAPTIASPTTVVVTATPTSSTVSKAPTSPISVSSPASTTKPTPGPSKTPSDVPASEDSKSKAWIAGVVIGPVVFLAVAGLGAWIIYRKKRKERSQPAGPNNIPPPMGGFQQPQQSAYVQNAQYPQQSPGSPPPQDPRYSAAPSYQAAQTPVQWNTQSEAVSPISPSPNYPQPVYQQEKMAVEQHAYQQQYPTKAPTAPYIPPQQTYPNQHEMQ